jgi:hypothetical protein
LFLEIEVEGEGEEGEVEGKEQVREEAKVEEISKKDNKKVEEGEKYILSSPAVRTLIK